jgi:hypothetical protein
MQLWSFCCQALITQLQWIMFAHNLQLSQLYTIMSHDFSQDKAVKKLGTSENNFLRLFLSHTLFKSRKADFHLGYLPYNQYLEKFIELVIDHWKNLYDDRCTSKFLLDKYSS